MDKFLFLSCGVFFASAAVAQTIKVGGKITNASGQAVSGAIVELVNRGVKDTTGADGMYALNQTVAVMRPGATPGRMTMTGGMLQLRLSAAAPIEVKVFDAQGNVLRKNSVPKADAGLHAWNLEEGSIPSGMMIIQASVGTEKRTFRYLRLGLGGSSGRSVTTSAARAGAVLSKSAADVDTLKVTADGYAVKKAGLSSYDATVNVALDPADKWGGLKNPPIKSAGCGKPQGIANGKRTIRSTNQNRTYIVDIPANYDPNMPYLLFYVSHWINGTSEEMLRYNFYDIRTKARAANKPAIFVAPQSDGGTWQQKDHALFDDIVASFQDNLCIDTTRIFAIGYSFGGMITYSLSTNHQHKIRAGVGIAPANFNIWLPNPKQTEPIAWMQMTGLSDATTPWISNESQKRGAKFIALEKAADNGCEIPSEIPIWRSGNHVSYEFKNCKTGYPVIVSTFNGPHSGAEKARDPGASDSWVPREAWDFFMRF